MLGRCVPKHSLKGFTSESLLSRNHMTCWRLKMCLHIFHHFSDDHVKFFCFQVLEHQIKFR